MYHRLVWYTITNFFDLEEIAVRLYPKTNPVRSSPTLVPVYQTTRRNLPENRNINIDRHDNHKPRKPQITTNYIGIKAYVVIK
jgi:hypothetical protein